MITRTSAVAAMLVAVMALADKCPQGGSTGGGGGNGGAAQPGGADVPGAIPACDTTPHAPKVILFQDKVSVTGSTTSQCDKAPHEHHVQVFLEVKSAGQWSVQADPYGQTAGNCLDIPSNGLPRDCTWIITRCQNGDWRTRVVVFGYGPPTEGYPLGIPFNFPKAGQPPVVSATARLTCKR